MRTGSRNFVRNSNLTAGQSQLQDLSGRFQHKRETWSKTSKAHCAQTSHRQPAASLSEIIVTVIQRQPMALLHSEVGLQICASKCCCCTPSLSMPSAWLRVLYAGMPAQKSHITKPVLNMCRFVGKLGCCGTFAAHMPCTKSY